MFFALHAYDAITFDGFIWSSVYEFTTLCLASLELLTKKRSHRDRTEGNAPTHIFRFYTHESYFFGPQHLFEKEAGFDDGSMHFGRAGACLLACLGTVRGPGLRCRLDFVVERELYSRPGGRNLNDTGAVRARWLAAR